MTNEQTAILLENYRRQLLEAISEVEQLRPDLIVNIKTMMGPAKRSTCLDPIREIAELIEDDIKTALQK